MAKSELFKAVHKLAKQTVIAVGNYMIAFSLALKSLYKKGVNSMETVTVDTYLGLRKLNVKDKLIEDGEGNMVEYTEVELYYIDRKPFFAYILATPSLTAVAVTAKSQGDIRMKI